MEYAPDETRVCPDCAEEVNPVRRARCVACRRERQRIYDREYTRRPEVQAKQKEYQRAYQQRPEVKAKHRVQALASYYRRRGVQREDNTCHALRTNGERCKANSMVGQVLCWPHSTRPSVRLAEVAP